MSAQPPESPNLAPPLEIKAGSITLPIVRLLTTDLERIGRALEARREQAPDFFRNAPVVIDVAEVGDEGETLDFLSLAAILRKHELLPVGVRGGGPEQKAAAKLARLALLSEPKSEPQVQSAPAAAVAPKPAARAPLAATRMVTQPVRSGQRIYAAGGDLIVLAQVSPGAEIMADGNIHVYAALKGRALAGVQGNLEARIFCSDLQAELVAIGGHYKISENLEESVHGHPIQVYLRDHSLIIEPLPAAHS